MKRVLVLGSFDDLRSRDVRFFQEAARLGSVQVLLLSDADAEELSGRRPKFAQAERRYLVEAIRYVSHLAMVEGGIEPDSLPAEYAGGPAAWAVPAAEDTPGKRAFCEACGLDYVVIGDSEIRGFPDPQSKKCHRAKSHGRKLL